VDAGQQKSIRTFRDLVAWQKGMGLAEHIYAASQGMPRAEQFGLTMQMRRAAVSVPSNIAEGYARQSTTEYLRFLRIARGSPAELATQVELSVRMRLIPRNDRLMALLGEEDRILQGLIRSLEKRQTPSSTDGAR
jgi:four helix bundle protein